MEKNIRTFHPSGLKDIMIKAGHKAFHAKQIYEWLWKKDVNHFDEMTNLSEKLRNELSREYYIGKLEEDLVQRSQDGTIKIRFRLEDDQLIEGVLIPSGNRMTACISSQAGCALNCSFCATGKAGFTRDLAFWEIVMQVKLINKIALNEYGNHLSNIVYMGMGEPFMNYDEVLKSLQLITAENGLAMSPYRITVSSVGIPERILDLGRDMPNVHFALSLHAADDDLRSSLIPVNNKFNLDDIKEALIEYHNTTSNRFSIEYLLIRNVNDTVDDAKRLADWCKSFPVKVNLIPYNSGGSKNYQSSVNVNAFFDELERRNMVVNIRRSRGEDIDAACGQLAAKANN
jgi:23S rRNA (adenine2503-C2)-methyltransferase